MNYPLHFLILGTVSILWLLGSLIEIHFFPVKGLPIPGSLGVVYSLTLAFALRKKVHIIRKCLLVVGGGLLSALVPFTGLFIAFLIGNVLGWEGEARFNDHYEYLVFGVASAIGALTFALLAKFTILPKISFYLIPVAMFLCVIATWTAMTVWEPSGNISMILLTYSWWFAFSIAIYIAENEN